MTEEARAEEARADNAQPGAGTPTGSDAAALERRIAELEAALQKERDQATDYMKKWQYAQAELANVRRRGQQERDDLVKFGVAPLAAALLEVLDNFERAEQTLPPPFRSYTWVNGVFLIHRQIEYYLQQHGVEAIETANQRYDPALHEAIAQEHHDTIGEGMIIAEVQRGYRMHGRLLRPALVRVSQGPAPKGEAAEGQVAGAEQPQAEGASAERETTGAATPSPDPAAQGTAHG
jgi:molecular chaperone GrpE